MSAGDKSITVVMVNYGAANFITEHLEQTLLALEPFQTKKIIIADHQFPHNDLASLR